MLIKNLFEKLGGSVDKSALSHECSFRIKIIYTPITGELADDLELLLMLQGMEVYRTTDKK